eukprot:UN32747
MLLTERFHFYNRYPIEGVERVVFYSLPEHAEFYYEIINWLPSTSIADNNYAITSLWTEKYDFGVVERIVGSKRTFTMKKSPRDVFMFQ